MYFTLSNGEKLFYEDIGSGSDTLVMMHGWTSHHEIYEKPARLLKAKARCIFYDHRGHGGSKEANRENVTMETLASDLNELMTGLHLERVTLVGWSMGAGVAMTYVRTYGCDALRQLVLCDMTPRQLNDSTWQLGLYQGGYTKDDMERDAGKDFFSLYKSFAVGAVPKAGKLPDFLLKPVLRKRLAACDEKVLTSLSRSMKLQDNRDAVKAVTVPLTYFYADPGTLFSPKLADWYREQAQVPFQAVPFPGVTHMLISDAPQKFAEELARLL